MLKVLLAGKYWWAKWVTYYLLFLIAVYVWGKEGSSSMVAQFHFHHAGVCGFFLSFQFFLSLMFCLVTGLHNLPCRSVLGLLSLLEDVLIQIWRKLGQEHGWDTGNPDVGGGHEIQRCRELDQVDKWGFVQKHSSRKTNEESYQVFLTATLTHCKNLVFKKPSQLPTVYCVCKQ